MERIWDNVFIEPPWCAEGITAQPSAPDAVSRLCSALVLLLLPLHYSQTRQCGLAALDICDAKQLQAWLVL